MFVLIPCHHIWGGKAVKIKKKISDVCIKPGVSKTTCLRNVKTLAIRVDKEEKQIKYQNTYTYTFCHDYNFSFIVIHQSIPHCLLIKST